MKKLLITSLCAVLVLGLAACGTTTPSSTPPPESITPPSSVALTPESSTPSSSVAPTPAPESSSAPEPVEQKLPPIPADAAMYRGTVTSVTTPTPPTDGSKAVLFEVTLEQAEGTNFGSPTAKFAFTDSTRGNFTPEKGQYLEVYYGTAPGQPRDFNAVHNVLTAIKYHSAEMVNYNGYVASITTHPSKPNEGWLMMVPTMPEVGSASSNSEKPSEMEIVNGVRFNYDKDKTKFYLNFNEIKVGDHLNIFQNGAMTMSLPPQSFAIEVRNSVPAVK